MGPRGGTVLVRDHGTRGPFGRAVFRLHGERAPTRFRGADDGGGTGSRGSSSGLPGGRGDRAADHGSGCSAQIVLPPSVCRLPQRWVSWATSSSPRPPSS